MSSDEPFLSRWSRRKLASGKAGAVEAGPKGTPAASDPASAPPVPSPPAEPVPLPPIESLDAESDFTPFMQPSVDPGLKRAALKKLFEDPRFNVMDGLDVYIDDYTKSDPIPEGLLEKMEQMRHLGVFRKEGEGAEPQPAPESGETAAGDVSVTASKLPAEQSVAPPASVTSSAETPAPPVGKSGNAEG